MISRLHRVGELVAEVNERNPPDGAEVFSVSEGRGIIPQRELFKKQIAIDDRTKYRCIKYGDVIFNPYLLWNGAAGVCFHKKGGCVSPAYPVLRPRHPDTERFLHYFFRSAELTTAVDAIATGSVTRRRTAPLNEILKLTFRLPEVPAQQDANRLLEALDDKIELNRQMNETLQAMAWALFKSWFQDFDPVHTKDDNHQLESLDEGGTPLSQEYFDQTNGEIKPAGWRIVPLTDVYEIRSGVSKPRSEFGFGHSFLTFMNVMSNTFVPRALTELVNSTQQERDLCSVMRGDVFLTRTSETLEDLGMSCVALQDYPQATFNGFTKRLRPRAGLDVSPEYVGFYFRSAKFRRAVTAMASLSTRASLNNGMLAKLTILLPPASVTECFSDKVNSLLTKIQSNRAESETLATLRDALLPKLLSGELSVNAVCAA